MSYRTSGALAICCFAALAGCAHEEPAPPPAPVAARGAIPVVPRATSASTYVATAGSIDLFVIRASELALQRSLSARVREVATRLIADHKGTSGELSFAGRRLNLLPSATLAPAHQAMLDQLQAAANFDAAYRDDLIRVHRQALALSSDYAQSGSSPTLRPVAAAAVPVIERDLRLIGYL